MSRYDADVWNNFVKVIKDLVFVDELAKGFFHLVAKEDPARAEDAMSLVKNFRPSLAQTIAKETAVQCDPRVA